MLTRKTANCSARSNPLRQRVAELEESLRELGQREERHRILLDCLPHKVFFKDTQSRFVSVNRAFADEVGRTPTEIVGTTDFDLFPRELAQKYREDDKRVMQSCRPTTLVERHDIEGEERYVEVTKAPVVDDTGSVVGLIGLFNDITERKEAEDKLRKQTEILQSILDSTADGIAVTNERGHFLLFNPAAQEILGLGPIDSGLDQWTESYGLYLPDMETTYPTDQLPLTRAMRGESLDEVEIFMRHAHVPSGIWLSVSARPLKDESGKPIGGVAAFRNVTERKQAHEALQRQAKLLVEQADALADRNSDLARAYAELKDAESQLIHSEKMAAIGQLVAGLAHEINNPASFVLTNITVIARDLRRCDRVHTCLSESGRIGSATCSGRC